MAFTYTGSGIIITGGCAVTTIEKNINVSFSLRDPAYVKAKAEVGVLDKVVIKRILIKTEYYLATYVDTFNAVWLEEELVKHEEAINLAIAYREQQEEDLRDYLDSLC